MGWLKGGARPARMSGTGHNVRFVAERGTSACLWNFRSALPFCTASLFGTIPALRQRHELRMVRRREACRKPFAAAP